MKCHQLFRETIKDHRPRRSGKDHFRYRIAVSFFSLLFPTGFAGSETERAFYVHGESALNYHGVLETLNSLLRAEFQVHPNL